MLVFKDVDGDRIRLVIAANSINNMIWFSDWSDTITEEMVEETKCKLYTIIQRCKENIQILNEFP